MLRCSPAASLARATVLAAAVLSAVLVPVSPFSAVPLARFRPRCGRGGAALRLAVERSGDATKRSDWLRRWRQSWRTRGVYTTAAPAGESLAEVSTSLGCKPPLSVPKWVWKCAWEVFKRWIPLLHFFDRLKPGDTCLNLSVAWWKAIAGNRRGAVTFDGGLAWDLLPPLSRQIIRYPLCLLFPRLHHQNVALRTAYLDAACRHEIKAAVAAGKDVRLVSLGAGFDTRTLKLATMPFSALGEEQIGYNAVNGQAPQTITDSFELDLPQVVEQKNRVLEQRLLRRRPSLSQSIPTLIAADLNSPAQALTSLESEMQEAGRGRDSQVPSKGTHVIFVCEALMIYLQEGSAEELMRMISGLARRNQWSAALCFADKLPGVGGEDRQSEAKRLLADCGWALQEWKPKPGLARHMGVATLSAMQTQTQQPG